MEDKDKDKDKKTNVQIMRETLLLLHGANINLGDVSQTLIRAQDADSQAAKTCIIEEKTLQNLH
jgi:hypothetical protein